MVQAVRVRSIRALALLLVLVPSPVATADWAQWGSDAHHTQTGTAFSGPDVVLDASWPITRGSLVAGPVVWDGNVLFAVGHNGTSRVFAAGLHDARIRELVAPGYEVHHLLTVDGDLVLVGRYGQLERRTIEGAVVWSAPIDPCQGGAEAEVAAPCASSDGGVRCGIPAAQEGTIFLACTLRGDSPNEPSRNACGETCSTIGFVQAIGADDGSTLWTWFRSTAHDEAPDLTQYPTFVGAFAPGTHAFVDTRPMGVTLVGGHVAAAYSISWMRGGDGAIITGEVTFLPRDGPEPGAAVEIWNYNLGHWTLDAATSTIGRGGSATGDVETATEFIPPAVARDDGRVAAILDDLFISDGASLAQDPARSIRLDTRQRHPVGDLPPGLAWGDLLYVAYQDRIFAVDDALTVIWEQRLAADSVEHFHVGAPVLAGPWLIVAKAGADLPLDEGSVESYYGTYDMMVLDAANGEVLWEAGLDGEPRFATSDGALAILQRRAMPGDERARLVVLGTTEASPLPSPKASTRYPAPGDEVRVDLSMSSPGALGAATAYRADWGDGTVSDWQASPVLGHRYSLAQDATATFFTRNDANQTGSAPLTFHVGAPPPLNWIQQQFSSDNQERTFFVLGLLVTLLLALFGILLARRRRNIVRRELDAMAAGLADRVGTGDKEAFLRERRARFMELHADRRIDEGQWALLERRADLHLREVRIAQTEAELGFLPYGLMTSLRRTLDDGKVTEAEYDLVLRAVEADDLMSTAQKKRTQRMLLEWRTSDLR